MNLEPKTFGGKLGDAIANHTRLVQEEIVALAAVEAAREALEKAEADGQRSAVEAKLAGKPVTLPTTVEDAETALRAAEYDAETSRRAVGASLDRLVDETTDPQYDAKLAKAEAPLRQTALNHLKKLEVTLDELAAVKANRAWLARPVRVDKLQQPTVTDVWIAAESVRAPNGDHARSRDLTRPLREALQGETSRINSQADWGIPVGSRLVGPWGTADPMQTTISGPAARAFEELVDSTRALNHEDDAEVPAAA